MDVELTKDSEKIISVAYAEYLSHLKEGMDKTNAKHIRISWLQKALPEMSVDNIKDDVAELVKSFSAKMYMDGTFELTNEMIVYMEKRFPKGVKQVIEFISTIGGIVTGTYGMLK